MREVAFGYDREPVIEQASFAIAPKAMVAVVGPNGSGKTTLLRLLLGTVEPQRGRVRVFGHPPRAVRRRIGYVPQQHQFDPRFPVTVREVVMMGRVERHWGPLCRHDCAAAEQALAQVDLADRADHAFADLSGGQRQRVLIARALASQPELLLLDEPTANVDWVVEQKLYELLEKLHALLTVVLVSHDLGVVTRYVDTVVCVNRRVWVHPTEEFGGEVIREVYGGARKLVRHDHNHHDHPHDRPEGHYRP